MTITRRSPSAAPAVIPSVADVVIQSEDVMGLWPATLYENSLRAANPCVFNIGSGYFHGSEESAFSFFAPPTEPEALRFYLKKYSD